MPFSYSGDPSASALDAVRFTLGDTNPARYFLQDGEIAYCLAEGANDVGRASVIGCQAIIAKLGPMCDQTVGSVSKSFSQMLGNFQSILANLRRAALGSGGRPFVGGTSHIGNLTPYLNPDAVRPQFGTRMMEGRRGAIYGRSVNVVTGQQPASPSVGYPYSSGDDYVSLSNG